MVRNSRFDRHDHDDQNGRDVGFRGLFNNDRIHIAPIGDKIIGGISEKTSLCVFVIFAVVCLIGYIIYLIGLTDQ